MSYISTAISSDWKSVLVWERNADGERKLKKHPVNNYFYKEDVTGEHCDIYGRRMSKESFRTFTEAKRAKESYMAQGIALCESDIGIEYKTISDKYYGKKEMPLNFTLYDIEVDYAKDKGFPNAENPHAPISAISLYHEYNGRVAVYVVPSKKFKDITIDDIPQDLRDLAEIIICKDERELLQYVVKEFQDSDIISGWNSDFFDTPYLYERMILILGQSVADGLSFPGAKAPYYREVEKFYKKNQYLIIGGRVNIDYMELYKNFTPNEKPSYSLEAISEEELPDLPKLSYDGTLYELYNDDFIHFVRYSVRDTEVLKGFEDKLGYMQLAISSAHSNGCNIKDVLGTIKLSEQAIINYCHTKLNLVIPDGKENTVSEKFPGALVLPPTKGMHDWISAIDIKSLYPSAIRSLNSSPETIMGQFIERSDAYNALLNKPDQILMLKYEDGQYEEKTAEEWKAIFKKNKWAISGFGTVFDQNKEGIIPMLLSSWYDNRKKFQAKVESAKNTAEAYERKGDMASYKKYVAKSDYYNRLQYIYKINLNSIYGALGNEWFKFYDIRLATSTTLTSREILMHMVRQVALCLDGEYKYPSESTVYSDTDSSYFLTHASSKEEASLVATAVEYEVNKSFKKFMQKSFLCTNGYDGLISVDQEIIADRGIFVSKKQYILNLVQEDGHAVDKPKVMGLALKKTVVPKPIRDVLTKIIVRLLKGETWKSLGYELVEYRDDIKHSKNLLDLGLPKGVKKVEIYTEKYNDKEVGLRLPGHVAASIFWNQCLEKYNDVENFEIVSGMKIKVLYFTKKFGYFKSIAVPTEMKHLPDWFVENFEQYVCRETQAEKLIEGTLKSILAAIGEKMPTKKTLLFDDLVEY